MASGDMHEGYGFLQYYLLVICLFISILRAFLVPFLFEYFTIGVDFKFADRKCLILENFLIRNCGCYKPCTMGNPGCCEGLIVIL